MMSATRATKLNLISVEEPHYFKGNDPAPHHFVAVVLGHPNIVHEPGVVSHSAEQYGLMTDWPHVGFPSV